MALVSSLLTAIVRADGDALVMHVGEKPYVVTHAGNVELSSQGLNLEAMSGMLTQLLPPDAMRSLAEFGAVEHELLPRQAMQGDRFTVVAARGGDDIWIEIRRHRVPRVVEAVPVATVEPAFARVQVKASNDAAPPPPARVQVEASNDAAPLPAARVQVEASNDAAPPLPARVQVEASSDAAPSPPARVQVEASSDAAPPPPARAQVEASSDAAPPPPARVQVEASSDAAPPPPARVQVEASSDAAPPYPARVQMEASSDAAPPYPARVQMEATHDVALPGSTAAVAVAAPPLPSPALVEARPVARVVPEPVLSEARPPDVRVELPPSESKPSEGLPSDAKPSEGLPGIVRPSEALPSHERPSEGLPSDARPSEGLPSDATPKVAATPIVAARPEVEATAGATSHKIEYVEPRVESAPPAAARPVRPAVLTEHLPSDARPSEVASARQASGHSSDEIPSAAPRTEPRASLDEALPVEIPPTVARPEPAASDGETSPKAPVSGEGGAVLVAMPRTMRIAPPRSMSARPGAVERLLALASSRGASVLCLTSQSRPYVRADGEIHVLEGEPRLAAADVEAAVLELTPEGERDALRRGEPIEWVSEFEGIGLIRCTTFRDYRGPGAFFHLISARQNLADQLGLAKNIQALATESDGLVIVAAPRGGGKSTLVSAFVDQINRRQSVYVVTLERQIRIVHDNRHSLISQREVRGAAAEVVSAARGALRENPDVLVLEDAGSAEVMQLALDAAGSGLLVFVSVTAPSTIGAIMRMLDWFPPERRPAVQAALAERLRGAVAQVMLRKTGGGRVAARELLLTTTAVATVLAEGQIAQLALAMDSGRKHGMVALNDALLALVQSGAVDVREAYRKADNQDALLNLLKREGVDTSFVERLA